MERIAKNKITDEEADSILPLIRAKIDWLKAEIAELDEDQPEQLDALDQFQGINLADYSLKEKRELLSIVIQEIRLRFDRMFITYNLFEAPGKLYTGRVDIRRQPAHNSKLRRRR